MSFHGNFFSNSSDVVWTRTRVFVKITIFSFSSQLYHTYSLSTLLFARPMLIAVFITEMVILHEYVYLFICLFVCLFIYLFIYFFIILSC